ncbi:MAG: cofactor-independent phosphoglycerate mutase [Hyphomonadaceae bacterium]|nr:cofactor-independent phosphoglycerate mutase [Clostridia bacterium]
MKYILILGDGMADRPVPQLGGKTPLQYANIPHIHALAKNGQVGLVKTIPDNISPGSDVANLSVMGYDPTVYYTGRSPLEAVSIGIDLAESDITFRCNLVTLSDDEAFEHKTMVDYSADEISTPEAQLLVCAIKQAFDNEVMCYYKGISYRHCLVWQNGSLNITLTPPHDISDQPILNYLPKGEGQQALLDMMKKSHDLLKNHPVNLARIALGLRPANAIWLWGQGSKPTLPSFYEKFGMHGVMISAVDLLKGIGIAAGLKNIDVPGATGNIHTNFKGKAQAVIDALKQGADFVYLHMEAPDECGHRGEIQNKVKSIELIDQEVVAFLKPQLDKMNEPYKILFLPDHATPLCTRTHSSEPVPFLIYESASEKAPCNLSYTEEDAQKSTLYFDKGHLLINYFLSN